MCFHPSVSLNNEKICCAISEDKIAVCEKTAGLRSGNFSDLNSACQKVVVPVKIFQFQDMLNENRFLDTFRGHSKRTKSFGLINNILCELRRLKMFEAPLIVARATQFARAINRSRAIFLGQGLIYTSEFMK